MSIEPPAREPSGSTEFATARNVRVSTLKDWIATAPEVWKVVRSSSSPAMNRYRLDVVTYDVAASEYNIPKARKVPAEDVKAWTMFAASVGSACIGVNLGVADPLKEYRTDSISVLVSLKLLATAIKVCPPTENDSMSSAPSVWNSSLKTSCSLTNWKILESVMYVPRITPLMTLTSSNELAKNKKWSPSNSTCFHAVAPFVGIVWI
mmetsp:Transcript_19767/g.47157  ORF Transcript_19767/g.47157 Transcript_19767/m.47157 type:complete len:207 (+) Transcript_19767:3630-4250(+)